MFDVMTINRLAGCKRCTDSSDPVDVLVSNASSDPLQVSECVRCGAILDIGGHQW